MKNMPIGISDFKEMITGNYYFIDKSMILKELLDARPKVLLFARPRRFGKTILMSMVKYYFDQALQGSTAHLFKNLKIAECAASYREERGKYPVIFLSLKDVKFHTWENVYASLTDLIASTFDQFREILELPCLSETDKAYYRRILDKSANQVEYCLSLAKLTAFLQTTYGAPVILLIDEYDTPIQAGFTNGFYPQVIEFIRVWLSGGLKDNTSLKFALLTGILRVAKESIFSGLNNLEVSTPISGKYHRYFGFLPEEVAQMARDCGCPEKLDEIKKWYDGYRFGGVEIYNPWSVINYFHYGCKPQAYWLHTSGNEIIKKLIVSATPTMQDKLRCLLDGKLVEAELHDTLTYLEIHNNADMLFTFLCMTGYLRIAKEECLDEEIRIYGLCIPNLEISTVYRKEILSQLVQNVPSGELNLLLRALLCGEAQEFEARLTYLIEQMVSYHDNAESFYHGFLLGITALLVRNYQVVSNRESGFGRFDLAIFPLDTKRDGVVMEFKLAENEAQLNDRAYEALRQIAEKKYLAAFEARNIAKVHQYGISFYGKKVKILQR